VRGRTVSMDPQLRQATSEDCDLLADLMTEFYAESQYPLNRRRAEPAFSEPLSDPRLGLVWLIELEWDLAFLEALLTNTDGATIATATATARVIPLGSRT
jgi:hypothetical protein